ncbi:Dihydropteroate synthase [Pluteus cervinus]|uniref:Dihydropteroate synthase n=1 Tax=Pluteus cervinus TaxID=181527 RepID=A0ACD3BCN7_9AGAR|nr:Dihydropteroate synthase [Pluteus cervinus]
MSKAARSTIAIAVGSNLGDRFHNIESALRLLEGPHKLFNDVQPDVTLSLVNTSFLYETAPMYVTDQPSFINCACIIETDLPPLQLLTLLKTIETTVGRVPSIRNGPRAVDLDIIFYGSDIVDTRPGDQRDNLDNLLGQVVIPHPRMTEREFVLRPLSDMIPDFIHPVLGISITSLLANLPVNLDDPPMIKVIPFPDYTPAPSGLVPDTVPPTLSHWTFGNNSPARRKTQIMATLNATPDSFSDGSINNTISTGLSYARASVAAGASIIDIGGYSTRPGAAFVSSSDEQNRVVPLISAIRRISPAGDDDTTAEALRRVPISIDTFRWEVAEAAILAGANCINDVYAFTGTHSYPPTTETEIELVSQHMEAMKRVARKYATPVILMHSRGDAGSNKEYDQYSYAGGLSVVEGVKVELGAKVDAIVKGKGGVRRWLVIVDPGIGFSKTVAGNLQLLRCAGDITSSKDVGEKFTRPNPLQGYPSLIGASRKSFLGALLSEGDSGRQTEPKERDWATAAAVSCAIQQGATVVRVHNVVALSDVVRMADAIWSC